MANANFCLCNTMLVTIELRTLLFLRVLRFKLFYIIADHE